MDSLWFEFRSSPAAFLLKNRTNVEALVHDLLQILNSEDKSNTLKLNVLGILQECGSFLLDDTNRLERVLKTLKSIFENQKSSSDPLYITQILVTITVLLLQSQYLESVQPFLIEFVSMLLEIIERIKSETNRLLRGVACDCLREIELAIPGLLSDIVGHLFGMSQAENSFIHQHYMTLFATVLCHHIQKIVLLTSSESDNLPDDVNVTDSMLRDVLFYSGRLPTFEPPAKYWKLSRQIATLPPFELTNKLPETTDQSELKKAIGFLIDHCHLFTTPILVQIVKQVIKIILYTTLSPVMLKILLLRYISSFDIQMLHLILLMKQIFSKEICDEKDEDVILRRIITLSGHPSLSSHQRALTIQWLLEITEDHPQLFLSNTADSTDMSPLQPLIFDENEIIWFKILTLTSLYKEEEPPDNAQQCFKNMLEALQKPVLYGIGGSSCQLLYRTMLLFCERFCEDMKKHVERIAADILIAHAEFTPQSLDLMSLVDKKLQEESMSGNILSEVCQWLLSLEITVLCSQLEHHLSLCTAAAKSKIVWSQIPLQILQKVITESSVCQEGDWSIGNAVLTVLCTLMKVLPSDGAASKELANLLLNMSMNFNDIDIRDRARIYLQIMLTVSNEKLSALLSESEIGSDLSQVVVARISNNVYPQPPLIKQINTSVFTLERVESELAKWNSVGVNKEAASVTDYLQWLKELESHQFVLHVPFTISLFSGKPDWISDRVYATVLQFSTSAPYHKPHDIQIPALALGEEVQLMMKITPIKPFPASFQIKGIFTNEDGDTCTCPVESIHISFHELFHSPPINTKEFSMADLFNQLWNYIETRQHSRSSPDNEGVLSVTRLALGHDEFKSLLKDTLKSFCVNALTADTEDSAQGTYKIILFLPPCYHILLKCTSDDSSTVVNIACDNWMLLPFVGEWLKQLSIAA